MMKKFFLFALALTIFAACNDDNDNGPDFETVNDEIVNGQIVDDDEMLFLGTSIVTNPDGTTFTAAGPLTPQAYINGTGWTPQAKYPITDLNGSIDNVFCTLTFTCMGSFRVQFTGRMLDD